MKTAEHLEIREVNPLDHAEQIKALFVAHDSPAFPGFFDRVYPEAVDRGARSWIGLTPDGRLVMHIVRFPSRFRWHGRDVLGGVTANLMVATEFRSLAPARDILRRVIRDSRDKDIDFLFTNPNPSSSPVLRMAKFIEVGRLARFVLPVAESSLPLNLAVQFRHYLHRWRVGSSRGTIRRVAAAEFGVPPLPLTVDSSHLVPLRSEDVFHRRIKGYPTADDRWYTVDDQVMDGDSPAVLLRTIEPGRGGIQALNSAAVANLDQLAVSLAPAWRADGFNRVELLAVSHSSLADRAVRGGFVARPDDYPLTAIGLSDLGEEIINHPRDWDLCGVDFDGPAE